MSLLYSILNVKMWFCKARRIWMEHLGLAVSRLRKIIIDTLLWCSLTWSGATLITPMLIIFQLQNEGNNLFCIFECAAILKANTNWLLISINLHQSCFCCSFVPILIFMTWHGCFFCVCYYYLLFAIKPFLNFIIHQFIFILVRVMMGPQSTPGTMVPLFDWQGTGSVLVPALDF